MALCAHRATGFFEEDLEDNPAGICPITNFTVSMGRSPFCSRSSVGIAGAQEVTFDDMGARLDQRLRTQFAVVAVDVSLDPF